MTGSSAVVEVLRAGSLTIARFPAAALGVALVPGATAGTARKVTGSSVLTSGVAVALDGPMFEDTGAVSRLKARLLDRAAGRDLVDLVSRVPSNGYTLSVLPDGSARIAVGAGTHPEATVAVQCWPTLAVAGVARTQSSTTSNRERVWRAALVQLDERTLAFVVGVGTLQAFANACATLGGLVPAGVLWAGYTDGGSSTELRASDGRRWGYTTAPRVPAWLVARAPLLPGSSVPGTGSATGGAGGAGTAPVSRGGSSSGGAALAVLGVLGALWAFSRG